MKPVQLLSCLVALAGLIVGSVQANAQSFKLPASFKKFAQNVNGQSQQTFQYKPQVKQNQSPNLKGLPTPQGLKTLQPHLQHLNLVKAPQFKPQVTPQVHPNLVPNKPSLKPLIPGPKVIPVPPVKPLPPGNICPVPQPVPFPVPTPKPCPTPGYCPAPPVAPAQPYLGVYLLPVTLPAQGGYVHGLKVTEVYKYRPLYGQDAYGNQQQRQFHPGADIILAINAHPVTNVADAKVMLAYGWNTLSLWNSASQTYGDYQIFID